VRTNLKPCHELRTQRLLAKHTLELSRNVSRSDFARRESIFLQEDIGGFDIWSEALIIYGIHKYITVLMNFGNIMGILQVLLNFHKVEILKK
jgi:hypothetical protein